MKINAIVLVAAMSAAVFASGCSGDKKEAEGPVTPEEERMKPNEVVEEVLRGFQTGETESIAEKFSRRVPAGRLAGYVEKVSNGRELLQFVASKPEVKGDRAYVPYLFYYQQKRKTEDGQFEAFGRRIKAKERALLLREKGEWRIRSFEPALDEGVEKEVFLSCLKAVSIAQLSEEKYFGFNRSFTRSFADMARYLPVDAEACASILVSDVEKDDYVLEAKTWNEPPCEIEASRLSVSPMSFSGCAGKAAPAAEAEREKPRAEPKVVIETLR